MKKITLIIILMITIASLYGDDLFTENANLKKQLTEQQKLLTDLQRQNQLASQITSLTTTNKILKGEISQSQNNQSKSGTVIWDYKLASPQEWNRKQWPNKVVSVKDGTTSVVKISRTKDSKGKTALEKWFNSDGLTKLKGKKMICTVMCKGKDIQGKGAAKFMLMIKTSKKTLWPGVKIGKGSFDWQKLKLTYNIPTNANSILLVLGLQGKITGSLYYKDLKVIACE